MKQDNFLSYFIATLLALSIFVLVYTPLELQVTEIWLLTPKISPLISTLFLLVLVAVLSLFDWGKVFRKNKLSLLLLLGVVVLSGFTYRECYQLKLFHEYLPKIYSISPPGWGFQASELEIRGKNFFPAHRKGQVFVGGQELIIEEWSDDCILAKQQVPKEFGDVELYLIKNVGLKSNSIDFEIKNPDELLNF